MASLSGSMKLHQPKDIQRRHRKSLNITFLLRVQSLNLTVINEVFLRDLLFDKMRDFKGTYGYFNKGHVDLSKPYGELESLIS